MLWDTLLASATPLGTYRGPWAVGKSNPPYNYSFLKKKFKTFILESDFSWDGGGTLSQISYKPNQDL